MIVKEFCAENFTHIPAAIKAGANRIELCDNLAVGGTTVSIGVMKETLAYCRPLNVSVMAMIRPRGGNFIYSKTEIQIMLNDLFEAKNARVDGVVFGALSVDGWLDEEALSQLIEASEGLQITFHMAFDSILPEQQLTAIDWLAANGVHRILTHGTPCGSASDPIENNFEHLKALIKHANDRIGILPGGKITAENCDTVMEVLGVKEVHGTKIVKF